MQAVKDPGPAGVWPVCMRARRNRTQAADTRGVAPTDGGRKVALRVQRGEIIRGENTLSRCGDERHVRFRPKADDWNAGPEALVFQLHISWQVRRNREGQSVEAQDQHHRPSQVAVPAQ